MFLHSYTEAFMRSELTNLEIRIARPDEMPEVKQLWSKTFKDFDPYLSWYFENVSHFENTVVAVLNSRVVSSLQLIDYEAVFPSITYKSYYIAGVCTDDKFRHNGLGSMIMKYAEEVSLNRGKDFLFLCPAIEGFYEKLGYKHWFSCTQLSFSPRDMKPDEICKKADMSDIPDICQMYRNHTQKFSGFVCRTKRDFIRILQAHELFGGGIYMPESGGYFIYEMSEGCMNVNEMLCPYEVVLNYASACKYEKVIIRSENIRHAAEGIKKPKYLYKVLTPDVNEDLFKNKGQYINILY